MRQKGIAMIHRQLLSVLAFILLGAGIAQADLDSYLDTLRVSAAADFGSYRSGLGAHYGASGAVLDQVFLAVNDPAHAALCFWLAHTSGQPMDVVLDRYRAHQKKGWGALAQSLGIKPGSADFKALKAGEIGWIPPRGDDRAKGGNAGKPSKGEGGKDKGHDKTDNAAKGKSP
jgi:hypothetical protein